MPKTRSEKKKEAEEKYKLPEDVQKRLDALRGKGRRTRKRTTRRRKTRRNH